jgi:sporulation protein YlmC with PRC-barrel domain
MEDANDRSDNPYTFLEGYKVSDASGEVVGGIEDTIYDAPSDVLKYVVVGGRVVPADRIEVHAEDQHVSVPYSAATVESAPRIEETSGAFDDIVRKHYG